MSVALFFPSATDPRAPMLALPSLAAWLRSSGVEVALRDLDVEGLDFLLRPERLGAALSRLGKGRGWLPAERRALLLRLGEGLPERAPRALELLRHSERFFHGHDLASARELLDLALGITAGAAPRAVTCSLEPIRYDVAGCDPRRLRDLLAAAEDPGANLFHDFWEEEVLPRLERERPLLAGVSLTNRQQLVPGLMLARRLKRRGHFVVLGGALLTKFADQLAAWPEFFEAFADGVVVFEGETALLELIGQLRGSRDFSRVPNFRYLERGAVRATPVRVEDLDALPTPSFEGLPLGRYLTPQPVLPVMLGKGCYHSACRFCDIPHINRVADRPRRPRRAERVARDLRAHELRHGARHFVFTDDALAPAALLELAEALGPDQGRYSFVGYARLDAAFSPDVCSHLAQMGVRKLFFGFESGSQATLDHMSKGTRVERAPAILRACHEAGLRFHLFSMVGLPEEDEAAARETLDFLAGQRDVLDHPGNSFDVHRFGLDVRAPYWARRGELGLQVAPGAGQGELIVSLGEAEWENRRGLTRQRTDELLEEFQARLRLVYQRHHNGPRLPWPPYEEQSLFYCERYGDGPFPFATALPADEDQPFELRLNPACARWEAGPVAALASAAGVIEVPAPLAAALLAEGPRTLRQLVARCGFGSDQRARAGDLLRGLVWRLAGCGILQVFWPPAPPAAAVSPGPEAAA